MTDPIRQYIDTHIPENHRQGDGCWDAAQKELGEPMTADLTAEERQRRDEAHARRETWHRGPHGHCKTKGEHVHG